MPHEAETSVVVVPQGTEAAFRARCSMRAFLEAAAQGGALSKFLASPFGRDDADLVVSELVTNAAEHGAAPITLRLAVVGDGMRIEVADGSPDLPHLPAVDHARAAGRGLRLVGALSDEWGTTQLPDGKIVWAMLRLPVAHSGASVAE